MKLIENIKKLKYLRIVKAISAVLLLTFLMFSISKKLHTSVENVRIVISKESDNKTLIGKREIRDILKTELGYDIEIAETSQLNLYKLERVIERDNRVNKADLYLDKHNNLHVKIEQKQPIVRIDIKGGGDYYLDYKGDRIPVADVFRVPVVTGYVDEYVENFENTKSNNLNDVLMLARKVHDDEFLNALVEQIYIDNKNIITIIPKVGRDRIVLGEIHELDEKIYKIKVYYENGIKNIGIDKFDELDVQWKGMVVERKTDT